MHYIEAEQSYEHTRVRSIRIFQEQVLWLLSTLRKTIIAILTAQSLEPSQSNRDSMSDIAAGLLPTNHTMLQTSAESVRLACLSQRPHFHHGGVATMIPSMMNLIQFLKERQHEYFVTATYPHEHSHISQNYVCLQHEAQQQHNNLRSYRKLETAISTAKFSLS
jgi:hypothetical protein